MVSILESLLNVNITWTETQVNNAMKECNI